MTRTRDNPVRRKLDFGESIEDQAREENSVNLLQETISYNIEEKTKEYNFDFTNEVPLVGKYEWYEKNGDKWVLMLPQSKKDDNFMQYNNENTPVQVRSNTVPIIRQRRRNIENRVIGQAVKRKLNVDELRDTRRRHSDP